MAADTDRARDALQAIPPDCDRETWVKVGMIVGRLEACHGT